MIFVMIDFISGGVEIKKAVVWRVAQLILF